MPNLPPSKWQPQTLSKRGVSILQSWDGTDRKLRQSSNQITIQNQLVCCNTKFHSDVIDGLEKVTILQNKNEKKMTSCIVGEERGRSNSETAHIGSRKFTGNGQKRKSQIENKSGETFYSSYVIDLMKQVTFNLFSSASANSEAFKKIFNTCSTIRVNYGRWVPRNSQQARPLPQIVKSAHLSPF